MKETIICVRLEKELLQRLKKQSEKQNRSLSNYVRHVLMEATKNKALLLALLVLVGCGSSSPTPTSSLIPTTPTTPTTPTVTLKSTTTCSDTGSFVQNQWVSNGYSVIYTKNTYSDGTIVFDCIFNSLTSIVANVGTNPIAIRPDGKASASSTSSGIGWEDSYIYDLRCPLNSPFSYFFEVAARPGNGWPAKSITDAISIANCTTANF
jgi:hypothetical protein